MSNETHRVLTAAKTGIKVHPKGICTVHKRIAFRFSICLLCGALTTLLLATMYVYRCVQQNDAVRELIELGSSGLETDEPKYFITVFYSRDVRINANGDLALKQRPLIDPPGFRSTLYRYASRDCLESVVAIELNCPVSLEMVTVLKEMRGLRQIWISTKDLELSEVNLIEACPRLKVIVLEEIGGRNTLYTDL